MNVYTCAHCEAQMTSSPDEDGWTWVILCDGFFSAVVCPDCAEEWDAIVAARTPKQGGVQ